MWYTPDKTLFAKRGLSVNELGGITSGIPSGSTLDDLISQAYDSAIAKIVRSVGMGGRPVGRPGQMPDECNDMLFPLIMRGLFERLIGPAADKLFTRTRELAATRADDELAQLARHNRGIAPPATESDTPPSGPPVTLVDMPGSRWDRDSMDGL